VQARRSRFALKGGKGALQPALSYDSSATRGPELFINTTYSAPNVSGLRLRREPGQFSSQRMSSQHGDGQQFLRRDVGGAALARA